MRKAIFAAVALILLAGAFLAGYVARDRQGKVPEGFGDPDGVQAIQTRWVREAEPPAPTVTIGGKPIEVKRGAFSWCTPSGAGQTSCRTTDAAVPKPEPLPVAGGALIETKAPEGIKEFTLTNTTGSGQEDPYVVPMEKGVCLYRIHCEWFLDQGYADFYFAVEVGG
ncbi:hypothetical protein J19TS2_46640 [Cohnella xylanilytica]|uniref:hypothetical protein n=1 Tax=Cohnella xylanilytica TaxID=557555 RepID=UPI001B19F319|nr:hypothetical protein [Cohnella xylanilytica]GIO15109.1 hypothetical protein J19TS2_46640 [Cohnella xylanilytica]